MQAICLPSPVVVKGLEVEPVPAFMLIERNAVVLSDDLSWHKHVDVVAAKASGTLGFLRRNLGECAMEIKSSLLSIRTHYS